MNAPHGDRAAAKPKVGIFGLTGCAGDQLAILDCEDELMQIVELVDLRDFLMASSGNDTACTLDIALVEGAVLSRRDEEMLQRIRQRSGLLVALGTCAAWGGIAAMDRFVDRGVLVREIYGEMGERYDTLHARALRDVVTVDYAISGCPIEKEELLEALANLLHGDVPLHPTYAVCTECKMRENTCLLVRDGVACVGAVTAAGCNARCPALGVPCVGCRGPCRDANVAGAYTMFAGRGIADSEVERKLRTFAAASVLAESLPGREKAS